MNRSYLSASFAIVLLALTATALRAEENKAILPQPAGTVPQVGDKTPNAQPISQMPLAERISRAEAGDPAAQNSLGYNYAFGIGVQHDDEEALKWLTAAASSGFAPAQVNLAYLYEKGRAGKVDLTQAFRWYRAAAEQGDAAAQYKFGNMYELALGVKRDYLRGGQLVSQGSRAGKCKRPEQPRRLVPPGAWRPTGLRPGVLLVQQGSGSRPRGS